MSFSATDPSWLEHYGFSHDPFLDHLPGFRFFPAQRKSVLAQLHHLARYSQLMLMVAGPRGAGKSLLRQALMASSNKQTIHCVSFSAIGCGDCDALVAKMAVSLGAASATMAGVMACVGEASLAGREIYLLVDDAQSLEDPAFEALLELSAGGVEGRAHVFLFGEPPMVSLAQVEPRGDLCHVIELQPYTLEETAAYTGHRLEAVGGGVELLSPEQVQFIHAQSGGWPGQINLVARQLLQDQVDEEVAIVPEGGPSATRVLPWRHLVAAAGVGLAVLVVVSFYVGGERAAPMSAKVLPLPQRVVPDTPAPAEVFAPPRDGSVLSGEVQSLPLPLPDRSSSAGQDAVADRLGDGKAFATPDPVDGLQYQPPQQPEEGGALSAPPVHVSEPAAVSVSTLEDGARSVTPVAAAKKEVKAVSAAVVASPVAAPAVPGNWYLGQPAEHYLLQVLGTRSEQTARDTVRRYGSGFQYFSKRHEGRPLFVVTYGNFTQRAEALRAIGRLPAPLQAAKPWARRIGDVQQEIRASL